MMADKPQRITVGRIGAVHGVRGWVRVQSFTSPPEKIFDYQPWHLRLPEGEQAFELADSQIQGNKLVACLAGVDGREQARAFAQVEITVDPALLPPLDEGEYYWHQLEGLRVISEFEGRTAALGRVQRMMETGANDVLVVRGDPDSVDRRERLIPYLPGQTVKCVDLAGGQMVVDWDPEF